MNLVTLRVEVDGYVDESHVPASNLLLTIPIIHYTCVWKTRL